MSALIAALAVFDDGALETLANKGLVRRAAKDVEAGKVDVVTLDGVAAIVAADGETVTLDARGPAAAHCSCPAPGVCRHKLAAVMALRTQTPAPPAHVPVADPPPAPAVPLETSSASPPAPAVLAEILAIGGTALVRWAGKAAIRAAGEVLEAAESPIIAVEGQGLVVRLGHGAPEIRMIPGQGLDGIISKAPLSKKKVLHAAAVLAVRRANGLMDELSSNPPQPTASVAANSPDDKFHAAVRHALEDGVGTALNQAPLALEDRLFELSVSSRADRQPRLASELRNISALLREKRARTSSIQPASLLVRMATAYALNDALAAAADSALAAALAGEVRQEYEACGPLTLDGLGLEIWRTRTGARGVTGNFYAHERARIVTVSLARASGADPSFDPEAAAAIEPIWDLAPLTILTRSRLTLADARLSPEGRLSLSADSKAAFASLKSTPSEVRQFPGTHVDWLALQDGLRARFAQRLTAGFEPSPILIAPAAHAAAKFDQRNQEYTWPLCDRSGRWVALTLSLGDADEMAGARLQRLSVIGDVAAVIVRPELDEDRLVLVPLTVLASTPSEPHPRLYELKGAAKGLERPSPAMRLAWLEALTKQRIGAMPVDVSLQRPSGARSITVRTLDRLADTLTGLAELGGQRRVELETARELKIIAGNLDRYGFPHLGLLIEDLTAKPQPPAATLLKTVYIAARTRAALRRLTWLTVVQH